jgi:hypothetical protein
MFEGNNVKDDLVSALNSNITDGITGTNKDLKVRIKSFGSYNKNDPI